MYPFRFDRFNVSIILSSSLQKAIENSRNLNQTKLQGHRVSLFNEDLHLL